MLMLNRASVKVVGRDCLASLRGAEATKQSQEQLRDCFAQPVLSEILPLRRVYPERDSSVASLPQTGGEEFRVRMTGVSRSPEQSEGEGLAFELLNAL